MEKRSPRTLKAFAYKRLVIRGRKAHFLLALGWRDRRHSVKLCPVGMALARKSELPAGVRGLSISRPSYRRVQAPIYHRPTSWLSHGLRREAAAQGGIRSYSDDRLKTGRLLEMDVFLPDGGEITALVEVEWCDPLPRGEPARFDVGMRIVQIEPVAKALLEGVLARD